MISPSRNGAWRSGKILQVFGLSPWVKGHMIEKIIVVAPDHGSTDENRFCRGFEGIARAVVLFKKLLCALKVRLNPKLRLDIVAIPGIVSIIDSS